MRSKASSCCTQAPPHSHIHMLKRLYKGQNRWRLVSCESRPCGLSHTLHSLMSLIASVRLLPWRGCGYFRATHALLASCQKNMNYLCSGSLPHQSCANSCISPPPIHHYAKTWVYPYCLSFFLLLLFFLNFFLKKRQIAKSRTISWGNHVL